jgi:hypothetical protein
LTEAAAGLEEAAQAAARKSGLTEEEVPIPEWVGTLKKIRQARDDYTELIRHVCRTARQQRDPCSIFQNVASDPFAKQRDTVEGACEREDTADALQEAVVAHCKSVLSAPLQVAAGESSGACARELQRHAGAMKQLLPARPRAIEPACGPQGAVLEYCRDRLKDWVDCRSGKPINRAVPVPSGIGYAIDRCRRMMKCVEPRRLKFEGLPSSSERADQLLVIRTTLSASCEEPFELSHRNNGGSKSLRWSAGSCDEASLVLELGSSGNVRGGEVSLRKQGGFAFLKLLAEARRRGSELTWSFPDDGVEAQFKVHGLDSELLGCAEMFGG